MGTFRRLFTAFFLLIFSIPLALFATLTSVVAVFTIILRLSSVYFDFVSGLAMSFLLRGLRRVIGIGRGARNSGQAVAVVGSPSQIRGYDTDGFPRNGSSRNRRSYGNFTIANLFSLAFAVLTLVPRLALRIFLSVFLRLWPFGRSRSARSRRPLRTSLTSQPEEFDISLLNDRGNERTGEFQTLENSDHASAALAWRSPAGLLTQARSAENQGNTADGTSLDLGKNTFQTDLLKSRIASAPSLVDRSSRLNRAWQVGSLASARPHISSSSLLTSHVSVPHFHNSNVSFFIPSSSQTESTELAHSPSHSQGSHSGFSTPAPEGLASEENDNVSQRHCQPCQQRENIHQSGATSQDHNSSSDEDVDYDDDDNEDHDDHVHVLGADAVGDDLVTLAAAPTDSGMPLSDIFPSPMRPNLSRDGSCGCWKDGSRRSSQSQSQASRRPSVLSPLLTSTFAHQNPPSRPRGSIEDQRDGSSSAGLKKSHSGVLIDQFLPEFRPGSQTPEAHSRHASRRSSLTFKSDGFAGNPSSTGSPSHARTPSGVPPRNRLRRDGSFGSYNPPVFIFPSSLQSGYVPRASSSTSRASSIASPARALSPSPHSPPHQAFNTSTRNSRSGSRAASPNGYAGVNESNHDSSGSTPSGTGAASLSSRAARQQYNYRHFYQQPRQYSTGYVTHDIPSYGVSAMTSPVGAAAPAFYSTSAASTPHAIPFSRAYQEKAVGKQRAQPGLNDRDNLRRHHSRTASATDRVANPCSARLSSPITFLSPEALENAADTRSDEYFPIPVGKSSFESDSSHRFASGGLHHARTPSGSSVGDNPSVATARIVTPTVTDFDSHPFDPQEPSAIKTGTQDRDSQGQSGRTRVPQPELNLLKLHDRLQSAAALANTANQGTYGKPFTRRYDNKSASGSKIDAKVKGEKGGYFSFPASVTTRSATEPRFTSGMAQTDNRSSDLPESRDRHHGREQLGSGTNRDPKAEVPSSPNLSSSHTTRGSSPSTSSSSTSSKLSLPLPQGQPGTVSKSKDKFGVKCDTHGGGGQRDLPGPGTHRADVSRAGSDTGSGDLPTALGMNNNNNTTSATAGGANSGSTGAPAPAEAGDAACATPSLSPSSPASSSSPFRFRNLPSSLSPPPPPPASRRVEFGNILG